LQKETNNNAITTQTNNALSRSAEKAGHRFSPPSRNGHVASRCRVFRTKARFYSTKTNDFSVGLGTTITHFVRHSALHDVQAVHRSRPNEKTNRLRRVRSPKSHFVVRLHVRLLTPCSDTPLFFLTVHQLTTTCLLRLVTIGPAAPMWSSNSDKVRRRRKRLSVDRSHQSVVLPPGPCEDYEVIKEERLNKLCTKKRKKLKPEQ
jgi:hypothetical protein